MQLVESAGVIQSSLSTEDFSAGLLLVSFLVYFSKLKMVTYSPKILVDFYWITLDYNPENHALQLLWLLCMLHALPISSPWFGPPKWNTWWWEQIMKLFCNFLQPWWEKRTQNVLKQNVICCQFLCEFNLNLLLSFPVLQFFQRIYCILVTKHQNILSFSFTFLAVTSRSTLSLQFLFMVFMFLPDELSS